MMDSSDNSAMKAFEEQHNAPRAQKLKPAKSPVEVPAAQPI